MDKPDFEIHRQKFNFNFFMNTELEKQLVDLIAKISSKEDFVLVKDQLLKRGGVESLLKGEIDPLWYKKKEVRQLNKTSTMVFP